MPLDREKITYLRGLKSLISKISARIKGWFYQKRSHICVCKVHAGAGYQVAMYVKRVCLCVYKLTT